MSGDDARRGERTVAAVGIAVALVAGAVYALTIGSEPRLDAPLYVSGLWLAVAFFGCEVFALRVERTHGETYGFTLVLVPLAVGLVYADPGALVVARMVGVALGLLVVRLRRPLEAIYELGVHFAQSVTAIVIYRLVLGEADPVGVQGAFSLLAALAASFATAGVCLAITISVVTRRAPGGRNVVVLARTGAVAALLNAAIGIGLATTLWKHQNVLLLGTAIVLGCLVCNRAYRGLAHRYKGLETHYEFVSSVVRSTDLTEITTSVLAAARKLLRANDALLLLRSTSGGSEPARRLHLGADGLEGTEVTVTQHGADVRALLPLGEPRRVEPDADSPKWLRDMTDISALAAPITGTDRSVVGALVVAQARRKATDRFGDADAALLGTLADQASIAIENGMLFHRLEAEAAERAHQATHDSLTGLPNRALLTEVLGGALDEAYTSRGRVGLVVIDLDSFSQVVDAFGHTSADGLLIQACSRIRGLLPESATLARLNSDQFAVVMPDVADADEVVGAVRLLIAGFDPPFQSEGVLLALGVNVGIAVYPEQAIDAQSLVQRAHIAADAARRHRSGWELYDPLHDPATPRRLALAADLREALETNGLDVCFQPKVELATGIVRGAEALVRWNHPRLGRVRPDEFITIAEHTGDIRTLTMVVMRKALAECRSWRDMGLDLSVAVNLSARNLLDLHLVDDVAAVIDEAGVPPSALTLELTESMVMSDSQRSVDVLDGLNELGVRLSCDDFGTGYSSLAHLRRLPICEIKIDKSFIARMAVDESDRAIARSVLALGRDLGLVTVAEGVESREGWDLLTSLGCDMAQGFVVCPPLTAAQFDQWLERRQPEEFAYLDDLPGAVDEVVAGLEAGVEEADEPAEGVDPDLLALDGQSDPPTGNGEHGVTVNGHGNGEHPPVLARNMDGDSATPPSGDPAGNGQASPAGNGSEATNGASATDSDGAEGADTDGDDEAGRESDAPGGAAEPTG